MTDGHRFDPTILREYDIRGLVDDTLTEQDVHAVGRAFGTMVRRRGGTRVCTGYDGRHSSPRLEAALTEGLLSTGLNVLRVGLGPTPMLYFATADQGTDAGLMITGSHNPPQYNGIKMLFSDGPVYGETIRQIGTVASSSDFIKGEGSHTSIDVQEAYVARLLRDLEGAPTLSVAWDAGNGATGEILRRLTARLPGRHVLLFDEIDGTFPNHHPDPTVEANLEMLKATVQAEGCDLGLAFDGDGDRIGAVDHKGRVVWGDQLLAIYAREVLDRQPGATIISDVKASRTLFDEISRMGGNPLMWKTGHSLIKAKMKETSCPLAGEMSGHIFFADKWYGFDDGLYCGIRLISLLGQTDQSLAALRDSLPAVINTPEIRFQVDEARKFTVIDEIKTRLSPADGEVTDVDGVRVSTADGWWLLRASNTQDVLVARVEAFTDEGLARLKASLRDQLTQSRLAPPADF